MHEQVQMAKDIESVAATLGISGKSEPTQYIFYPREITESNTNQYPNVNKPTAALTDGHLLMFLTSDASNGASRCGDRR